LRVADSDSHRRQEAASFLERVRRVAFLATPHAGSGAAILADRLRIIVRPSAATACLVRNDPNLRDLNFWYRERAVSLGIAHLILTETRSLRALGLLVKPDSSDPGLPLRPIPIDADHISICKPKDRSSEIYVHIRNFITQPLNTARVGRVMEILEENRDGIRSLTSLTQEQHSRLREEISNQGYEIVSRLVDRLKNDARPIGRQVPEFPQTIIDNLIQKDLCTLRRARFFIGFSRWENASRLAGKILNGEFAGGSDSTKGIALAWCARVIAIGDNSGKSDEWLSHANNFVTTKQSPLQTHLLFPVSAPQKRL